MSELDRLLVAAREAEPSGLEAMDVDRAVGHAAMTGRARHRAWVRRRVFLAAGTGAALAAAVVLLLLPPPTPAPPPSVTASDPVTHAEPPPRLTPRERTDLELPTGDRLLAAEGSRFSVELATQEERRIRLVSGSMLFDVRPLEDGRFRVTTPDAVVTVLGTVFTVSTERDGTVVRVYEGRVELRHGEHVEIVRSGEAARVGEARIDDEDPLAGAARRAARVRRSVPIPATEPVPEPPPRPRPTRSGASDVERWIAGGEGQRALDAAREHIDRGEHDPWALLEADALRSLGRRTEAADAYGRAAAMLPPPRSQQAGFASARLHTSPEMALRALDSGAVTAPGSPLRERGLALRVDLLDRLGRDPARDDAARAYLMGYPEGSRAESMRRFVDPPEAP